jgi:hypothetical protein
MAAFVATIMDRCASPVPRLTERARHDGIGEHG